MLTSILDPSTSQQLMLTKGDSSYGKTKVAPTKSAYCNVCAHMHTCTHTCLDIPRLVVKYKGYY